MLHDSSIYASLFFPSRARRQIISPPLFENVMALNAMAQTPTGGGGTMVVGMDGQERVNPFVGDIRGGSCVITAVDSMIFSMSSSL